MIKRPPLARRGLENPANIQTGNPDILPKNRCFEAHCLPTSPRQELNLKCSLKPLTMSSTAASVGRIPRRTVSRQHLRCNSTDKSLKPCSVNRRQIFGCQANRAESDKPDSNTAGKLFYLFSLKCLPNWRMSFFLIASFSWRAFPKTDEIVIFLGTMRSRVAFCSF